MKKRILISIDPDLDIFLKKYVDGVYGKKSTVINNLVRQFKEKLESKGANILCDKDGGII